MTMPWTKSNSTRRASRIRSVARSFSILVLCASLLGASGCFGRFPTTKAIYKFNDNVSQNEFYESLTFWGLTLVLVYPYGLIADLLVLNPIQFWTGESLDIDSAVPPAPDPEREVADERQRSEDRWSTVRAATIEYTPPAPAQPNAP